MQLPSVMLETFKQSCLSISAHFIALILYIIQLFAPFYLHHAGVQYYIGILSVANIVSVALAGVGIVIGFIISFKYILPANILSLISLVGMSFTLVELTEFREIWGLFGYPMLNWGFFIYIATMIFCLLGMIPFEKLREERKLSSTTILMVLSLVTCLQGMFSPITRELNCICPYTPSYTISQLFSAMSKIFFLIALGLIIIGTTISLRETIVANILSFIASIFLLLTLQEFTHYLIGESSYPATDWFDWGAYVYFSAIGLCLIAAIPYEKIV